MTQRLVLGPAVRAIREALGIKGSVFCIRVGISHSYLVRIEKDGKQPSPEVARAIATELGVTLDAITYPVREVAAA